MTKKRILIVDDEPMMLKIMTRALCEEKYKVDTAFNRITAETLAAKNKYDLVICDVFLPDTRMLEFVDFLKDIDLDYRIILMSGFLEDEGFAPDSDEVNTVNTILLQADRKGVSDVIKKPFDIDELRNKVSEVIGD
ncbi:MAG: response regulator [Planctomycetota bacterium]|jgi:DNA-binding response OmpR family regulator